jgi:hypothetical protein
VSADTPFRNAHVATCHCNEHGANRPLSGWVWAMVAMAMCSLIIARREHHLRIEFHA